MKYRNKSVVVEAIKFNYKKWVHTEHEAYPMVDTTFATIGEEMIAEPFIKMRGGKMEVLDGDYIVRGAHGEFYPCKPDIFEEIYEPVPTRLTEKHIIGQSELCKSKIDLEKYNRTIECINRILKACSVGVGSVVFGLNGEYELNQFEREKLVREIKEAGYGCELSWGSEPKSIGIWLKK